ncbi:Asp-tRNA(Asn)/Glu-tRNA(Gln) amidotransferase subunit GatC [Dyadobacter fanqingshengii]|uniref:Aspartyl/glutamyl-tRNA(Asn/Gln) amidotransferase subunit C n=1 Tax=Dyadobacter fanqingshengii TaxID=2906443 RepID=A0A9X1P8H1_9BACT|nr:Asp-tRNA(Asn)/Glu-tRNA(Gln) amidotransferase subunit GatC [Dyadobacter fanqingshengii]MCF0038535.1 Asp-tRNA(Asn)/Glu-tRNA(Gln) amidotransferase subunit GatC [Dyadobacter fanqingshengii]USJ34632.1 Asp-tRNA(Asn)/Glu-tRNA(Gln) amidotransferase subunit GatC [Dyadobacter fanqingshengii]
MKIDKESLKKIAHLARLEIKPGEEEGILKSMDSVLTWMEQLNEVNTEGVEPLTHILSEVNNWREDEGVNTMSREEALANAPAKNSSYIMVPKVIE